MSDIGLSFPVAIFTCCRDWPVNPLMSMRPCGYCGERPEPSGKTVEQYMADRRAEQTPKESA